MKTIDYDFDPKHFRDMRTYDEMKQKIKRCPNWRGFKEKDSERKGMHLTIICNADCDKCRLVFDDINRYSKDSRRPKYAQNVLFNRKGIVVHLDKVN